MSNIFNENGDHTAEDFNDEMRSPIFKSISPNYIAVDGISRGFVIYGSDLNIPNLRVSILKESVHDEKSNTKKWEELQDENAKIPTKDYDFYLYNPTYPQVSPGKFPFSVLVNKAVQGVDHLVILTTKAADEMIKDFLTSDSSPYDPVGSGMEKVFGHKPAQFKKPGED